MKQLQKQLFVLVMGLLATLAITSVNAETFREGVDYTELKQPIQTADPSTIEVREFFWFGCPHCFKLESFAHAFAKDLPDGVVFLQTPAPLNKSWMNHAHAFYVMEALGKTDVMAPALFNQLHVAKNKIFSQEQLATFFGKYDVSTSDFNKLFQSFSVRTKVRQAEAFARAARLNGVPAMVVNGKYVVGTRQAKGFPRMMQIVNFLIEKEKVIAQASAEGRAAGKG
ncbi:hypothetical protein A9Q99_15125 [Gammaproteobacteria bacterium 45_16_T64]|nr:hypothetical protein A9Q99_15125 [Gammaproteobacteria bacterium 45_16_T64]